MNYRIMVLLTGLSPFSVNAAETVCSQGDQAIKQTQSELLSLDLEQLMNLQITPLKNEQAYATTPASVYVITDADIRRLGASTIPEALRYVPGLHVARIDASKWAITARGFNDRFSNKLLVMIDGRSVYTNFFGGVYWEDKDVFLEDVARIEVIRGPGASLYGSNAVNGVINIITKTAEASATHQVTLRTGTQDKVNVSIRRLAQLGAHTCGRFSVKYVDRDNSTSVDTGALADGWDVLRFNFRIDHDWDKNNAITLQGDVYNNAVGQSSTNIFEAPFAPIADFTSDNQGHNLLLRWQHKMSFGEETTLQIYYDQYKQESKEVGIQKINIYDFDFDYKLKIGERHGVIWGVGFRLIEDRFENTLTQTLNPSSRSDQLYSFFAQDDISLVPDTVHLILGAKVEHNDYSGFEYQPSARLSWNITPTQTLWASVSRAVRVPTRAEHEVTAVSVVVQPGVLVFQGIAPHQVLFFQGSDALDAENLLSYEVGFRTQLTPRFLLDIATFYNRYEELRTIEPVAVRLATDPIPHFQVVSTAANRSDAVTYGLEVSGDWRATEAWRLTLSYSYLDVHLHIQDKSQDIFSANTAGSTPRNQLFLRSSYDLNAQWELDGGVRYVDRLSAFEIDSYVTVETRVAYKPTKDLTLSVVVNNVFDQHYEEFRQDIFGILGSEAERELHAQMTWQY